MATNGIEDRKEELWALLTRRVGLWTGLDHSSVTAERAQHILDSTLYTLHLGEAALEGGTALAVGEIPLEQLYALGRKRIGAKRKTARGLWRQVRESLPPSDNLCLRETMVDGMAAFFRGYEPEFSAHEHIITCDYPLAVPVEGETGITLIEHYLERALRENRFCALFPAPALRALWRRAGVGPDSIGNLFSPVLASALGCVLLREDPSALAPSPGGVAELQRRLSSCSRGEVDAMTQAAQSVLTRALLPGKPALARYLQRAAKDTAADFFHGAQRSALSRVFGS